MSINNAKNKESTIDAYDSPDSEFSGHYIFIVEYDKQSDQFLYLNPANSHKGIDCFFIRTTLFLLTWLL